MLPLFDINHELKLPLLPMATATLANITNILRTPIDQQYYRLYQGGSDLSRLMPLLRNRVAIDAMIIGLLRPPVIWPLRQWYASIQGPSLSISDRWCVIDVWVLLLRLEVLAKNWPLEAWEHDSHDVQEKQKTHFLQCHSTTIPTIPILIVGGMIIVVVVGWRLLRNDPPPPQSTLIMIHLPPPMMLQWWCEVWLNRSEWADRRGSSSKKMYGTSFNHHRRQEETERSEDSEWWWWCVPVNWQAPLPNYCHQL